MLNAGLKPQGIRTTYIEIDSTMDPGWGTATYNPANFMISLPNAIRTNKVWKVSPNLISVPRMFPNIMPPDDTLVWYQRQVIEVATSLPNYWLRTVAPNWTATRTLAFPQQIWNLTTLLAYINAATGANEVWSFDTTNGCLSQAVTPPSGGPIAFGIFYDPAHVPPAVTYANMTYVIEGNGGHVFDVLGLEKQAIAATSNLLSPVLLAGNPLVPFPPDPNSFDNIVGSNLEGFHCYPLFDRTLHNYTSWSTLNWASPVNDSPNLGGPSIVHIKVADLGDSSSVDSKTGTVQDILATVAVADVNFGEFKSKEIRDVEGEGIEYQQARNISKFQVMLLDARYRQLSLPINYPVHLKLQMLSVID